MSATSVASPSPESRLGRLDLEVPREASELVSIALGGLLFAVLGAAMEWKPGYILVAAISFAAATWLARSLGRALICLFGSLGLIAGVMVLVAKVTPGITESLAIGWGTMFVAWWLVAVALGASFRAAGVKPEFNVALAFGCALSVGIAAIVAVKLNFQSNLLFYVVGNEDNAAWVGLATQNGSAESIATRLGGTNLGPVMPLLLGVLGGAQRTGLAVTNSVFAAYTLAVVISPLVAASLIRGTGPLPRLRAFAFTLIVFAWVFLVPALLYRDFGHLSTIWAFLAFLAFASLVIFDRIRLALVAVAGGVLLFLGGVWFPIAPLSVLLAAAYCLFASRRSSSKLQIAMVLAFILLAISAILQLRSAGVAIGTNPSELSSSIRGLYQSAGGVAQIEPILKVLVLVGVVGLSFLARQLGPPGSRAFLLLATSIAYVLAVTAGSLVLGGGDASYGATKVTFVLLFAGAVVLVALAPRLRLDSRQALAMGLALTLGALMFGGGTLLLQRSWPGDGTFPSWLPAVELVTGNQKTPRPVVCFGDETDPQESYSCTRWAGALTTAGDGAFVDYRLMIVKGGTGASESLKQLEAAKTLPGSDVIFLQRPTRRTWWGPILLREGGRVFGPSGEPLKQRRQSAIEVTRAPTPAPAE